MIQASTFFNDLLSPAAVLVPRASLNHGGWLTDDLRLMEAMAGSLLLIRGTVPTLLHRASFRREHLALYEGIVQVEAAGLRGYGHEKEFQTLLQEISGVPGRIMVQHRYPEAELPAAACAVSPVLLGGLNRKSRLEQWVQPENLLPRRILSPGEAARFTPREWPVVLKASGPMTTGGGADVRICRGPVEWEKALLKFHGAEELVLEKYENPHRIMGLQFGIHSGGKISYLGCTENELKPDGLVHGNWLDSADAETLSATHRVMEKAVAAGYRGMAGLDCLMAADGRFWIIDLNFRCTAGTPLLLLSESLRREWGCRAIFSSMVSSRLHPEKMFPLLREGMERCEILLAGGYFPSGESPINLTLLVVGKDREEVHARRRKWARLLQTGPKWSWGFLEKLRRYRPYPA